MTIWIKGGELIDPVEDGAVKRDLIIERGRIVQVLPEDIFSGAGSGVRVINAAGKLVVRASTYRAHAGVHSGASSRGVPRQPAGRLPARDEVHLSP